MLEQLRNCAPYQWASRVKRSVVQAHRERVARVLFRLPPRPVPAASPELASIHLLTSQRDWLGALWSVRTFLDFLGESLPIMFHDDGTLTPESTAGIRAFLPGSVVISAEQAQSEAQRRLHDFPRCLSARQRHIMTHKLLDVALFAPGPRYLLLDSDLLFFRRPEEIATWLRGGERVNLWNEDQGDFLNLTQEEARVRHGVNLIRGINAGFGCVWRESVDFRLIEEYIGHESVWRNPHRVEQTAYALLSARFGVSLLPRTYLVDARRQTGLPAGIVMKHYVGKIRDLFFSEGIRYLITQGFVPGSS